MRSEPRLGGTHAIRSATVMPQRYVPTGDCLTPMTTTLSIVLNLATAGRRPLSGALAGLPYWK